LAALTILIVFTGIKILMAGKNELLLAEEHLAKKELSMAVTHYEPYPFPKLHTRRRKNYGGLPKTNKPKTNMWKH